VTALADAQDGTLPRPSSAITVGAAKEPAKLSPKATGGNIAPHVSVTGVWEVGCGKGCGGREVGEYVLAFNAH
jgi:hypothetical protein